MLENTLVQILQKKKQQFEEEERKPIRIAKQYMQNHYMEPITLELVADKVGFNSSYFSDISAARLCELATVSILHSILALTRDEEQMEKGEEIAISIERKRMPVK